MVPLLLLLLLNPHICKVHKIFHPHLLLVLKKTGKLSSPHPQETPNIPSPPPRPPPPPPSPPHETTKPIPPNGSAKNNHAKEGTSRPNTSVIGPGETPLGKNALEKPSAISNQQGNKLAENNISTPHTTGKKSLEKPSAISKLQEEKLAKKMKLYTSYNRQASP
jgi:hypothetical protein